MYKASAALSLPPDKPSTCNVFSFIIFNEEKDTKHRLSTPFIRKDTPIKRSHFSNIIITLILTFRTYIEQYNYELQDFDFSNILLYNDILTELNEYHDDIKIYTMNTLVYTFANIQLLFRNLYEKITIDEKILIISKYLYIVNKNKLKITSKQYNMSFQDLIYNNYSQWQVGYSGTASLSLNQYDMNDKNVFREIIPDYDEKIEILLAFKKYGYEGSENVLVLKKNQDVSYYLQHIKD